MKRNLSFIFGKNVISRGKSKYKDSEVGRWLVVFEEQPGQYDWSCGGREDR